MSIGITYRKGPLFLSLLGLLASGCASGPATGPSDEEEDIEARAMRTEMMQHRARFEPKGGLVIPINNRYNTGVAGGFKASMEAVQKGMWLGVEFDYASIDSANPINFVATEPEVLAARTEQLMKRLDRYEVLFTFDYDIPTGNGFYYPIFRFGLGLGAVGANPEEADGNSLRKFDTQYNFVGRPSVGFRFPIWDYIGAFVEGNYDFIPQKKFRGKNVVTDQSGVEIGNAVELSTFNIFAGISLEW